MDFGHAVTAAIAIGEVIALLVAVEAFADPNEWLPLISTRFWRAAPIRWLQIFFCACMVAAATAALWLWWIVHYVDASKSAPTRGAWVAFALVALLPHFAAACQISEAVEEVRGRYRVLTGWAFAGSLLRAVARGIALLPITALSIWAGAELIRLAIINFRSVTDRAFMQSSYAADTQGYVVFAALVAIVALVVTFGWWLVEKFLMARGGARRGGGLKSVVVAGRAVFWLAIAAGVVWVNYHVNNRTVTANGRFGQDVDNGLWWISESGWWFLWAMAAGFAILCLRDLVAAFATSAGPGDSDGVHGRADLASEEEAADAARGRSGPDDVGNLNLDY